MLKNVANEIAKGLNLEAPEPGEEGEYFFLFDDIEVEIISLKKTSLTLVGLVSDTLADSPETQELLKKILQSNFSRLKEYEEVLTWDPDSSSIILSKEISFSELSEKPILGQLENFLNNLEFWKYTLFENTDKSISPLLS